MIERRVSEVRRRARQTLESLSLVHLTDDAETLLESVSGLTKAQLHAYPERELGENALSRFRFLFERLCAHEPLAYLLGHQSFHEINLVVDSRVLIPRPETEFLVELALQRLKSLSGVKPLVVDVGTGSGAIILAIANAFPLSDAATFAGCDRSLAALQVAQANRKLLNLSDRVSFFLGDLLEAVMIPAQADVIVVANLPYIAESAVLDASVRDYEPASALFSGEHGLDHIERLIQQLAMQARTRVSDRGSLGIFLEVGAGQAPAVISRLSSAGFCSTQVFEDHHGIQRVVSATYE